LRELAGPPSINSLLLPHSPSYFGKLDAGQDGLDLQAVLARDPNAPPMVFLTGSGDIATTVPAMRHGAEDFLTKDAATVRCNATHASVRSAETGRRCASASTH
jgi:FixJ family two-component response regulator